MTQRITINGASDTVAAMPALLGYQPIESMCILALSEHGETALQVGVCARIDLPLPREAGEVYRQLRQQVDSEMVGLVAYTASQEFGRAMLQDAIAHYPGTVRFASLASMAGVTSVDPEQPDVVQWTDPWSSSDASNRIAAAMSAAGQDPAAYGRTRADLVEQYGTSPEPSPDWPDTLEKAFAAAVASPQRNPYQTEGPDARTRRWQTEVLDWVRGRLAAAAARGGPPIGQIGAGQAAYALTRITVPEVRDAAWLLITGEDARTHVELWAAVARFAGDTEAARPAVFLAGMASWVGGHGTIASICAERLHALPHGRGYSATKLLDAVLFGAVPPDAWPAYRQDLIAAVFGQDEIP